MTTRSRAADRARSNTRAAKSPPSAAALFCAPRNVGSFFWLCRKYRLRYFRNIDESTLRSACHAWQACVQRNRRLRFAHFCPRCFLYHPRVPQAAPACLRSFAPKSFLPCPKRFSTRIGLRSTFAPKSFLPCPERFSASSAIPTRVLPADPARTQRCSSCV